MTPILPHDSKMCANCKHRERLPYERNLCMEHKVFVGLFNVCDDFTPYGNGKKSPPNYRIAGEKLDNDQ